MITDAGWTYYRERAESMGMHPVTMEQHTFEVGVVRDTCGFRFHTGAGMVVVCSRSSDHPLHSPIDTGERYHLMTQEPPQHEFEPSSLREICGLRFDEGGGITGICGATKAHPIHDQAPQPILVAQHDFLSSDGSLCEVDGCAAPYLHPVHGRNILPNSSLDDLVGLPLSRAAERALLRHVLEDGDSSEHVDYPSYVQGACAAIRALRRM